MKTFVGMIALVALAAAGCNRKPTLMGKWAISGGNLSKGGASSTIDFTENKFALDIKTSQSGIDLTIKANGSYTVEGETLTMTTDNVTIDDSKVAPQFKAAVKNMLDTDKVKAGLNKESVNKYKLEGNSMTITSTTGGNQSMTLTRVKS